QCVCRLRRRSRRVLLQSRCPVGLLEYARRRSRLRTRLHRLCPQEGPRVLRQARPGVLGTLGRGAMVAVFLAGASCAREGDAHRLRPTETIVGRAALGTETVLLTDRPALVHVDRDSGRQRIVPIRSERAPTEFWGLAENDAALYTVARFDTLLRIEPDGAVVDVAALDHSVSNLIDLVDGVAGQRASGTAGEPLLVRVDPDGSTRPLLGPTRRDLGLSPPEALLLQLLRCSAPPRVLCWSAVYRKGVG